MAPSLNLEGSVTLTAAGRKHKGDRAEREVLTYLRDHLGAHLVRARLEGQNDHGDITGLPDCAIQVKWFDDFTRASREGLDGALEQKANAGLMWAAAFVRRRGGRYVVVMTPEDFVSIYREAVLRRDPVRELTRESEALGLYEL